MYEGGNVAPEVLSFFANGSGYSYMPVSYTHLDVYKRQNLNKFGQNCVDFGERMWYDINVPRQAQGLFSKNAEQLF